MKQLSISILSGVLISVISPANSQTTFGNRYLTSSSLSFSDDSSSFSFGPSFKVKPFNPQVSFASPSFISSREMLFSAKKDTLPLPHKNYLRNDDPAFNKKYSPLIPAAEVVGLNIGIWSFSRFVTKESFAYISGETIKNNFKNGWEWDTDDFVTNYSLHPYTGSLYFNAARSNGYAFYESTPFVLGGSLMWEMFMENTAPSYNDLINTTISGIFLGEVLYRLSSSMLDDRKTGSSRVLRELMGTVLDPVRSFNRLLQGKSYRVVNTEVYQKEPLSLSLSGGVRQVNDGTHLSGGTASAMLNFNFLYGDAFEIRYRKPFDFFHLRADLSFGNSRDIVNNVIGDGYLFGKSMDSSHQVQMLMGVFQHYDYWNTDSFEIGTVGFGGGVLSRVPVFRTADFQNQLHLALVPLGASNTRKVVVGDINSGFKDYTFSGGAEMKFETSLNMKWGQLAATYYLYWLHTYVGRRGDNVISIVRPRITVKLYRSLNIGYEYLGYYRNDYYPGNIPDLHVKTGEQRIYLLLNFENF